MREENRSLHLKLRDTEVMNDDYERQARNTEFEKEDLEGRYNAAIERGVLLEETVKVGEQEREALRIETQRLRDELSDLKVESEITLEKLRLATTTIEGLRASKPSSLAVEHLRARSPASEASGATPLSPTASTPPPKSDTASEAPTPPSPPLSDAPANGEQKTPMPRKRTSLIPEAGPTPRAARGIPRHSRGPSLASSTSTALSDARAMKPPSKPRPRPSNAQDRLPRSESLQQIRGLIGRMQKIEQRVHSARSKLPSPGTPRGSPRAGSALGENIPSSVTVRRSSKRPSASTASSVLQENDGDTADGLARCGNHVKRLSYGTSRPASAMTSRSEIPERPPSALDRPPSAAACRPSSRASYARPPSRSGARTDFGHYSGPTSTAGSRTTGVPGRPQSSLGGSYTSSTATTPTLHRSRASISGIRRKAAESEDSVLVTPPRRRTSGIPGPSGSALPAPNFSKSVGPGVKPRTNTIGSHTSNRFSPGKADGTMRPPPRRTQTSDIGETY